MKKNTRKKGNKKHDKKKRHTRRKLGGEGTKLPLPYTYLAINREMIEKNNWQALNNWVHQNKERCACMADNINCPPTNTNELVLQNDEELILVIKFNILQRLFPPLKNLDMNTNFDEIKTGILGFCIIKKAKNTLNKPIIAIYDVCLTNAIKKGKGKLMFSILMTYIEVTYSTMDVNIWLGIKLDNVNFDKVCNIYTSYGFSNPFISVRDIFGNQTNFSFLSLNKHISHFVNDEDDTISTFHNCLYMKNSFHTNKPGAVNLVFSNSCLFKLRLFPLLTSGGIVPLQEANSPYENHHEYSGSLLVTNDYYNHDTNALKYKLAFETIGKNRPIEYKTGEKESVMVKYNSFTYHTHPVALYKNYGVLIGTPSGGDFVSFIQSLTPYEINTSDLDKSPGQCHFVITLEGIYCISLHENFIKNFLPNMTNYDLPTFHNDISTTMEYPFPERTFDWNDIYTIPQQSGTDRPIIEAIEKYKNFFTQQNNNFKLNDQNIGPIFNMEIYTWKELFDPDFPGFSIIYPKIYKNYFMPSEDYKNISKMFGDDLLFLVKNNGYKGNEETVIENTSSTVVPMETGDDDDDDDEL